MIIIGRIDWYGDRKAKQEGRNWEYGYVTSLDKEIKGSFKLYQNQLRGNYFLHEENYKDALVAFFPDTKGNKPKAVDLYHVSEYPDLNQLKEALSRYDTNSDIFPEILKIINNNEGTIDDQIEALISFVDSPYFDTGTLLPFIKNDHTVIDHKAAFLFITNSKLRSYNSLEVHRLLRERIKDNTDYYFDKFSQLTESEKNFIVKLMPDDFLIENPNYQDFGTDKQKEALSEHLREIKQIENANKIREIAERRGIKYFVHFTRIENLRSILEHGLLTRRQLDSNVINYISTDNNRIDRILNSISLSVSYHNYKMFYVKKLANPDAKWCILLIKAKDVLEKPCLFNQTNAASKASFSTADDYRKSSEAFEAIFAQNVGGYSRTNLVNYGNPESDCYATDPQAEILCCATIPVESICKCIFEDEDLLEEYKEQLDAAGIEAQHKVFYIKDGPYANYSTST